jgi:alkanesulfonate monooxygenase SsuD/methylene tetrahydromethanopterin reductase-like flavin-dependent oxidoreductase (luciferase family)
MHVGYSPIFQNHDNEMSDREVFMQELRLTELAEPMGFDSIWTTEHHFSGYEMMPDILQFLSYIAGRTKTVRLGSMAVILPWHNPLRVAENVCLLDHYSNGRYILGIGRGLGFHEMEGWGVDMSKTRGIFNEGAEALVNALKNGYMEHNGEFVKQIRRDLRPAPFRTFAGRTYGAGMSAESMPLFAKLGMGVLVVALKAWSDVRVNMENYRKTWREHQPDTDPPKPAIVGFCVLDEDPILAEELAIKHISQTFKATDKNYDLGGAHFAKLKGYEHYAKNAEDFKNNSEARIQAFVELNPYGTPKQVLEKLRAVVDEVGAGALITHFRFGSNSFQQAEKSMRLFAEKVLPVLKTWDTGSFAEIEDQTDGRVAVQVPRAAFRS